MKFDCEFLFAALAEKHNAVIRKIRETPPWEWGGEFLELDAATAIIETIKAEHAKTRRQIIKAINSRNTDGLDITGPRTPECRDQVLAVVVFLANPKHPQSIHHACEITFRKVRNGYHDAHYLFVWCNRNESRIWAWVETYRLNHGID